MKSNYVWRFTTAKFSGDPYLDDTILANLFAFLLEGNETRRADERADDLREILMRPVDTAAIEAQIDRLQTKRDNLDQQLDELESLRRKLPDLELRRKQLDTEIDAKRTELQDVEAAIEDAEQDRDTAGDPSSAIEDTLEIFREARSDLEDVRYNIETERESIAALEAEIEELEGELASVTDAETTDVDTIDGQLASLRDQRKSLDATVNALQKVIQFNEEMLDGTNPDIVAALRGDTQESITDELVDNQAICWTCESEVDTKEIEATLDRLQDLRQDRLQTRRNTQSEIAELKTAKTTVEERKRQRAQLKEGIQQATAERDGRQDRLADLKGERDQLEDRVADLETKVEEQEEDDQTQVIDLQREATEREFELNRLETDRAAVVDEIERIEADLEDRKDLETERADLQSQIADLRTRIDDIERETVNQFNAHMDTVLEILDYANLPRIWIKREQQDNRQGRHTGKESIFDLHVVRRTAEGAKYEDTVDHLSESDREVTGLIFGLRAISPMKSTGSVRSCYWTLLRQLTTNGSPDFSSTSANMPSIR